MTPMQNGDDDAQLLAENITSAKIMRMYRHAISERDRYREALEQVASENGCFSINAARVIARAALDG